MSQDEPLSKRRKLCEKITTNTSDIIETISTNPRLETIRRRLYIKLTYCSYSNGSEKKMHTVRQLFANKDITNSKAFQYICDKYARSSSKNFTNDTFDYNNFSENDFVKTFTTEGIKCFSEIWYKIINYQSCGDDTCVNYNSFGVTCDLLENNVAFNIEIDVMNTFLKLISGLMVIFTYHRQFGLVYSSFCDIKNMTEEERTIVKENRANKYNYQSCSTGSYGKIMHVLQFGTVKKMCLH